MYMYKCEKYNVNAINLLRIFKAFIQSSGSVFKFEIRKNIESFWIKCENVSHILIDQCVILKFEKKCRPHPPGQTYLGFKQ